MDRVVLVWVAQSKVLFSKDPAKVRADRVVLVWVAQSKVLFSIDPAKVRADRVDPVKVKVKVRVSR